jgi:hypothetical protein
VGGYLLRVLRHTKKDDYFLSLFKKGQPERPPLSVTPSDSFLLSCLPH